MRSMKKQVSFETKEVSEKGVISGVLNHFGNKDHANDITLKGAFAKSLIQLKAAGRDLVVLWQHDPTKPIGVWKNLRETERGLEGDAHLNMDVALAREAYALVKQGAVTGFSIGYYVVDEEYDRKTNTNYLKVVELQETSLVTFPCNDLSRTEEIKMKLKANELPTQAELKTFMVENGITEADAARISAKYLPNYVDPEEAAREKAEAEAKVKELIEKYDLDYTNEVAQEPETTEETKEDDSEEPEAKTEEEETEESTQEEKSNSFDAGFFNTK